MVEEYNYMVEINQDAFGLCYVWLLSMSSSDTVSQA